MMYCIKRTVETPNGSENQYLAVLRGNEYPLWTDVRRDARKFASLRTAQTTMETWRITDATVTPWK